jgi:hypothetical protein
MIGEKIINFRKVKAKQAREKKKLEEEIQAQLIAPKHEYRCYLKFEGCEALTFRADKI